MNRPHHAYTLLQATQQSPVLGRLTELAVDSSARLKSIQVLIPESLRAAVKAGPIEGSTWCLIVENNAAASKLRQMLPALEAHLRSTGWEVTSIRLKILKPRSDKCAVPLLEAAKEQLPL